MDTKISLVEATAVRKSGPLFVEAFGHSPALVVADGNTMRAAGFETIRSLEKAGIEVRHLIFDAQPPPSVDEQAIAKVRMNLSLDSSIAVVLGSGTLNDLTKCASFELNRPYMVVATAPSMDGYTAFGAVTHFEGVKRTIPCSAPVVVIGDTDVLAKAPIEMIGSGFVHCIALFVAGMDELLADLLGVHPIRPDVWKMVQQPLRRFFAKADLVATADKRAIGELFEVLIASGFAMQILEESGSSKKSVGLVSDIWQMQRVPGNGPGISEGGRLAFATVLTVHLYEEILELEQADCYGQPYQNWEERESEIRNLFENSPILEEALATSRKKFLADHALLTRRKLLASTLPSLQKLIERQLPPLAQLRAALALVGVSTRIEELGLDLHQLKRSVRAAQMIGDQYTLLDFYWETGLFDRALNSLEGLF